jgi:uncharacterized membrane protein
MTWLQRYRIRHYLRNSIWVFPVLAMVAALTLIRLLDWLDQVTGWQGDYHPDTMRAVLGSLAGAMFSFIVFVCSSLLLVVQLASAQLTPRIIGTLFRDTLTKLTLSLFVFTFTFSISSLLRIGTSVPLLTAEITAFGAAACLGLFIFLIDHIGKMLRPSGALHSVASQAHQVIDSVYPHPLIKSSESFSDLTPLLEQVPSRTVASPGDGVVLAFDVKGLVALGTRHNCIIELVPQAGNFVATNYPLFRIYGGAGLPSAALCQCIALGAERTMEQDPAFAFRVIVDIASKGLSPAVNDPTTAVLAIDRIHHLLRHVGSRRLDDERVRDATGKVRLMYRTPDWEDFVTLAVTEIRHFGGLSIQVARRLRAMLEDLIQNLPEERAAPLRQELKLLQRSAARFFVEPEDRALADISDAQGVGGRRERSLPKPEMPVSKGAGRGQAPFSAPEDNSLMPKKVPDPLPPQESRKSNEQGIACE